MLVRPMLSEARPDLKSVPLDWHIKLSGRVAQGWRQAELQLHFHHQPPAEALSSSQQNAGMRPPHRKQALLHSGSGSPVIGLRIYKQAL